MPASSSGKTKAAARRPGDEMVKVRIVYSANNGEMGKVAVMKRSDARVLEYENRVKILGPDEAGEHALPQPSDK